jgi:hypothetical protein
LAIRSMRSSSCGEVMSGPVEGRLGAVGYARQLLELLVAQVRLELGDDEDVEQREGGGGDAEEQQRQLVAQRASAGRSRAPVAHLRSRKR